MDPVVKPRDDGVETEIRIKENGNFRRFLDSCPGFGHIPANSI